MLLPLPLGPTSAVDVPALDAQRARRQRDDGAVVDADVGGDGDRTVAGGLGIGLVARASRL